MHLKMNSNLKGRRQHFFFFRLYPSAHRDLSREVNIAVLFARLHLICQGKNTRSDLLKVTAVLPAVISIADGMRHLSWLSPVTPGRRHGDSLITVITLPAGNLSVMFLVTPRCAAFQETPAKLLTPAAAGLWDKFRPRATCRLQRGQRKRLPRRQTTAAAAHELLWFITMWLMHI